MNSIAHYELEDYLSVDSVRSQLLGPIIQDHEKYVEYKWYKELEWGDTAAIFIDVYKYPSTFSWRDDFFWPRLTMNYQWYYFSFPEGTSKFADALPQKNKKVIIDSLKIKLYQSQNELVDSLQFIVIPNRLFFFLRKGYFTIVEKNDAYSIVDFYQPIATIYNNSNRDTTQTMSAKIYLNDALELIIQPIDYY